MTEIQTLVGLHYILYQRLDISTYVTDLFDKKKYLYNDIENVAN